MASDARIAEARANSFSLLTSRPDHWLNTTVTSASSMSSDASMGPHSLNSWIFKTFCPESFAISNKAAPTLICLSLCQMTSLLLSSTNATPAKTIPLRRIRGGVVAHGLLVIGVVGAAIASQIRLRDNSGVHIGVHKYMPRFFNLISNPRLSDRQLERGHDARRVNRRSRPTAFEQLSGHQRRLRACRHERAEKTEHQSEQNCIPSQARNVQ